MKSVAERWFRFLLCGAPKRIYHPWNQNKYILQLVFTNMKYLQGKLYLHVYKKERRRIITFFLGRDPRRHYLCWWLRVVLPSIHNYSVAFLNVKHNPSTQSRQLYGNLLDLLWG